MSNTAVEILEKLREGGRKEIGAAREIARDLVSGVLPLHKLLETLVENAEDPIVVSHGTYALKEACHLNNQLIPPALEFLLQECAAFTQWEAKENFLRIALIAPKELPNAAIIAERANALMSDKSSIVAAYALEICVVLTEDQSARKKLIANGLSSDRAAVRARARTLDKSY